MIREFQRDNTEACLEHINNNEDLNIVDNKKNSLLQMALQNNNLVVVKALLSRGADINYINPRDKSTPLFTAIQLNFLEGAQALLQTHKVDVEAEVQGRTYLEHAVVVATIGIVELLIRYKVPQKGNLLHLAINAEQLENALYLIQNGIGLTDVDEDQENVVHILAFNGNAELLNALIKKHVETPINVWNQLNKEGNAPIHIAAINEKQLFLKVLLSKAEQINLDVNKTNKAGLTYKQIQEERQKSNEQAQQEQQVRKRQVAEERKERQQQRQKEVEQQINDEKESKKRLKEAEANREVEQKQTEKKNRLIMVLILGVVLLGFYVALQLSIKKK